MDQAKRYLDEKCPGGRLAGLKVVPAQRVAEIARLYPWISKQYLQFIADIGVGNSPLLNIYEPEPLEAVARDPSYQLYRTPSHVRAFGLLRGGFRLSRDVVMIADVGAAWRYCLSKKDPSAVFCFDMASGDLMREADGFFHWIDNDLLQQP